METYKTYIITQAKNDFRELVDFVKKTDGFSQPVVAVRFNFRKAAQADLLFVDEVTARKHCRELTTLKKEEGFLPVILLSATTPETELPECIDDLLILPFLPGIWKRKLKTFAQLRQKAKQIQRNEKKEAGQLLKESEENYHKIIEDAPDIIVFIDQKGIIRYVNQRIKEYGYYEPRNIVGKPVTDFIPPEDTERAMEANLQVYTGQSEEPFFSTSLVLKDGRKVPVLTRGILVKHNGETLNMTILRDISAIRETENRLRESKETFENIFNNRSVAIYLLDRNGVFLDINKAALKQYGYEKKEDLLGKTPEFVAAGGRNHMALVKRMLKAAFRGKPQSFEFWAKRRDGSVFPKLVLLEKGTYFGKPVVYSFSFDITERKKMEEALRESEEKFNSIFNSSPYPAHLVNKNFEVVLANNALLKLKGYKQQDVLGKKCYQVFQERNEICEGCAVKQVFEKGIPATYEGKITKHNGEELFFSTMAYPISYEDNTIKFVVESSIDTTEKKRIVEKLKESEEKYRLLFEKAPYGIVIIRPDGEVLDANPVMLRILGSPSLEATRRINVLKFQPLLETGYLRHFKTCLKTGEVTQFKTAYNSKWGKSFVAETTFVPLKDEKGQIQTIYVILRDITEQYKAEQLLKESEEKYRSIFQTSSDAIAITEFKSGRYIEVNDRLKKILGYSAEEMLGKTASGLGIWANLDDRKKVMEALQKKGYARDMEISFRSKEGKTVTGLFSAQLIHLQGKDYILSETRDITRIKETEDELRKSRQLFETLANISPTGIFRTDANGKTTYVNPKWCKIAGLSAREAVNNDWTQILPPDEKEALLSQWKESVARQAPVHIKYRIITPRNKEKWVLGHAVPEIIDGKLAGYVGTITEITGLVKAEQALRESENRYRTLAETSSDLILTFNTEGILTFLNPAIEKLTGYTAEEALGRPFWDFIAPEHAAPTIEKFKRGIKGEEIPLYEIDLIHKSGKRVPVELHVSSLLDHERKPVGRLAVVRDITERREAEKALKESQARLKRFAQITTEGIVIYKNPIIVDANQSFLKMTGYTLKDLLGQDIVKKLAHPKYYPLIRKNIVKKYAAPYEIEIFKKDGSLLPVEISAIDFTDDDGDISRAVVFHDITQRLKMDKSLRESENKYRLLAEGSIDMIVTYDLNGTVTYINPVVKSMFGYSPEEIIGTKFTDYITPETVQRAIDAFNKGKHGEKVSLYELELIDKKGNKVPIEVNPSSLYDANGEIIGRLAVVRDITVRKAAEKELLLRDKALNAAANAIIITDPDCNIEWANQAFCQLTGYAMEEVLGKNTSDLVNSGKQDQAFFDEIDKILKSGQVWKGEVIDKRKDGTLYEVEEIITPVTNEKGEVEYLIGIMTDISDRKAAERELLAAKEAAEEASLLKTAFLANMNHEIRTPMNAIMGFSELIIEADSAEEKNSYAQIVNNSSEQLLNLIDDVIFLSRLQSEKLPVKKTAINPAYVLEEVFEMFNLPEMKKGLDLRLKIPENKKDTFIFADNSKIRQVLTNFVSNAIKYTPEGFVTIGYEFRDKDIVFFVEDTGIGVPKEEQKQIFNAFYRGKKAESSAIRGTGLGLNIAKELVELMGGKIGVFSEPDKGSRFYFSLPFKPALNQKKQTEPVSVSAGKWEDLVLLIAEDDETNYLYLDILLKPKVKRIDWAVNGEEALQMVQNNRYDLVFMDLKMPVMTGYEATRKIKKQFPALPVIATTAFVTQEEKERALAAGCDAYLGKPINKNDLLALVEKYVSGKKP